MKGLQKRVSELERAGGWRAGLLTAIVMVAPEAGSPADLAAFDGRVKTFEGRGRPVIRLTLNRYQPSPAV
ncbi:hypothetical protein [Brachymonas denitrificans]|uniref:hypothetical protein n=1 Tax=Brachymonas denitrificans TaxID=28220 RepID=UPI001BCBECC1|nr:hypothetical protein [Brachymonas denitrificans]